MAVPFGFSVGDFLAAIELTIRTSKAIRQRDEAAAEYHRIWEDLQLLGQFLEILKDWQPTGANASHINAIRGMALSCLVPLRDFSEKLKKSYNSALKDGSSKNAFQRSGKQIQWALLAAEEVTKFRVVITSKVASISMLLNTSNR